MKKIILAAVLLILGITAAQAQITNVSDFRIPNATTAFGRNLPEGSRVFDMNLEKYYIAKEAILSTETLTTASALFKDGGSAAESDPLFTAWDKSYGDLTNKPTLFSPGTLLSDYGFTDNSTNWNTAFGWGDHASANYLTSFTESDPVFIAWNKSTGITITESQISDLGSYLTSEVDGSITNEIQALSINGSDLSISGGNTITLPTSGSGNLNGAKTASFTHDCSASLVGDYSLNTSGAVTLSLHNLSVGSKGVITLDIGTNPSAITVNAYTDAGTTAIAAGNVREGTIANAANEATLIVYRYYNNGTDNLLFLGYQQLN